MNAETHLDLAQLDNLQSNYVTCTITFLPKVQAAMIKRKHSKQAYTWNFIVPFNGLKLHSNVGRSAQDCRGEKQTHVQCIRVTKLLWAQRALTQSLHVFLLIQIHQRRWEIHVQQKFKVKCPLPIAPREHLTVLKANAAFFASLP